MSEVETFKGGRRHHQAKGKHLFKDDDDEDDDSMPRFSAITDFDSPIGIIFTIFLSLLFLVIFFILSNAIVCRLLELKSTEEKQSVKLDAQNQGLNMSQFKEATDFDDQSKLALFFHFYFAVNGY